jgi:predicted DNA-binding helix-hairpin-helix protein
MADLKKVKFLENSYDVCGGGKKECGIDFIYDASTPRGSCPIFKTLQSNACSFDCKYCVNSTKTRNKSMHFESEELARTFISLQKQYRLEGFFLSSSVIKDPDSTTERMIETVKLVRHKYNYKGYIHFKILPGTSYELIKQASELASRMSINIESPSKSRLTELSGIKDFKTDILRRQAWIKKLHGNQTTQLIVGATDETDLEILKIADWEYKTFNLKRIYYSGFKSGKNIELKKENCSPIRQNRLYNVDYLFRKYNYKLKEIREIINNGMLPKEDPKLALAKLNFQGAIEINEAEYKDLIRIPGIGPRSAKKIIECQLNRNKLNKYSQLQKLGIRIKTAKPFIKVDGKWQKRLIDFN